MGIQDTLQSGFNFIFPDIFPATPYSHIVLFQLHILFLFGIVIPRTQPSRCEEEQVVPGKDCAGVPADSPNWCPKKQLASTPRHESEQAAGDFSP